MGGRILLLGIKLNGLNLLFEKSSLIKFMLHIIMNNFKLIYLLWYLMFQVLFSSFP